MWGEPQHMVTPEGLEPSTLRLRVLAKSVYNFYTVYVVYKMKQNRHIWGFAMSILSIISIVSTKIAP
jgi:hypothetical protein